MDRGTARKQDEAEEALHELRAELRRLLEETDGMAGRVTIDPENGIDIREEIAKYERQLITKALRLAKGQQKRAAQILNLSPSTLNVKMKALGVDPKDL